MPSANQRPPFTPKAARNFWPSDWLAGFGCGFASGCRKGADLKPRGAAKRGSAARAISAKEQELFTAQKGFKNLYEQELASVRAENDQLKSRVEQMNIKVEEYRKKAAGLGGLFSSSGKKADAIQIW